MISGSSMWNFFFTLASISGDCDGRSRVNEVDAKEEDVSVPAFGANILITGASGEYSADIVAVRVP